MSYTTIAHCLARLDEGSQEIESYAEAVLNAGCRAEEINYWRMRAEGLLRKMSRAASVLADCTAPPNVSPTPDLWWSDLKDAALALARYCSEQWDQSLAAAPGLDPHVENRPGGLPLSEYRADVFHKMRLRNQILQVARWDLDSLWCQAQLPATGVKPPVEQPAKDAPPSNDGVVAGPDGDSKQRSNLTAEEEEQSKETYQEVLLFAQQETKKKERRTLELLCNSPGGRMPLADLALAHGWTNSIDDAFGSHRRRINLKLKKIGWRVRRQDNCAVLVRAVRIGSKNP